MEVKAMEARPEHMVADADGQTDRLRAALDELNRMLDAGAIRVLREAVSDSGSWRRVVEDPRGYLEGAGVDVPADTEVMVLVPGPRTALRPAAELACRPITKYEWGCKNFVTIRKPVMGPGGQPIDYIEVQACVEWGLIAVEELYCRSHPWFNRLAG
ncbi:MAG: hypothetical protein ACRDOP_05180 [Gaiellaceae bacterium]